MQTIWLTGLPGSGKTTLAWALHQRLKQYSCISVILDGDAVRTGLCKDLGFSAADRRENIRRVAEVARLMNDAGIVVLCALVSPSRGDREMARKIIGTTSFLEIHVATPLEVCEGRDPKGLYKRAREGELRDFTGVSALYEVPLAPALVLDTTLASVNDSIAQLVELIPKVR